MKKERRNKQKETVCEKEKIPSTNKADVDRNANVESNDPKHLEILDVEKQQSNTSNNECQDEKKTKQTADVVISTLNDDLGTLTISEYRGFYLFILFKSIPPDDDLYFSR